MVPSCQIILLIVFCIGRLEVSLSSRKIYLLKITNFTFLSPGDLHSKLYLDSKF